MRRTILYFIDPASCYDSW